jgi:hypothetical protein
MIRRRLFTITAAISLLLFIAATLLWIMGPTLLLYMLGDDQIRWGNSRRYAVGFTNWNAIYIRGDDLPHGARVCDAAHRSLDLAYGSDARRYEMFYAQNGSPDRDYGPIHLGSGSRALVGGIGADARYWHTGTAKRYWWIEVSLWLPLGLTLALPLLALISRGSALPRVLWRAIKEFGVAPGHCRHCGYNLAGNTSGACPECGTAIATKAVAKT